MKNERTVYTSRGCFPFIRFSSCNRKNENGYNWSYFYFSFFVWGLEKRKRMLSYPFSILYYEIEKRKTKGRYIHGPTSNAYFHNVVLFPILTNYTKFFMMSAVRNGPLARYAKLWVAYAQGMPGTFSPPTRVYYPDMHHGTCVTHVPWCIPGSLTSDFLWSRWRGKRSQHSRCMCNPHFTYLVRGPCITHGWLNITDPLLLFR